MRLITVDNLKSLQKRGYIQKTTNDYEMRENYSLLSKKLKDQKIDSEPYISIFVGLSGQNKKQLIRFICLKWHHVANQLNDTQLDNFQDMTFLSLCHFFLDINDENQNHRVYFFIEMLYQYFFP